MTGRALSAFFALTLLVLISPQASAAIIAANGPASTLGALPAIVGAPAVLLDASVTNRGLQGFNERQGVRLTSPLATDQGVLPAGTWVNSHMVFFNEEVGLGPNNHTNVSFQFGNPILGTMSDFTGSLEAASSPFLGAPGTTYPGPFNARGLEGNDLMSYSGNTLFINSFVNQPGDWVRVITAVPEPSSALVFATVLGAGGWFARRRRRK